MPRKHLISSGINKKQQQQAKIWMKCAKEIKVAAKMGGINIEANPRLKKAVIRALSFNLSRDSINRNIEGAIKDKNNLRESFYEGYGPNGIAIIIKVLTDNELRAISAIRGYFSKLKGQLAKPNSVMNIFEELGEFIFDKKNYSQDDILEATLECNIKDIIEDEEAIIIYCEIDDFENVKEILDNKKIAIHNSEIKYIPDHYSQIGADNINLYNRFIANCEDNDDILWVISNAEEI